MALHVIVLAGGSGTRLWPLSRAAVPKHLLPLAPGGRSLLRATVERVLPLGAQIHVVTVADQADACGTEIRAAGSSGAVIAEPAARGTGPAIGLAVGWIAQQDPDAVICSVHADHHVGDDEAYRAALWDAAGWARATEGLATVGITPTRPATGFGYVTLGPAANPAEWRPPVTPGGAVGGLDRTAPALPANRAGGFVEKPQALDAARFLREGTHLWNTGLFAWTARTFLRELQDAAPQVAGGVGAAVAARAAGDEDQARDLYLRLPNVAVEPLVLERTERLTVVHAAFPWSDLGSWTDLVAARRDGDRGDACGNVVEGDAIVVGAERAYVDARQGRTIAVVGTTDTIVIDTGDVVLVLAGDAAQQVRTAVEWLRETGRVDIL